MRKIIPILVLFFAVTLRSRATFSKELSGYKWGIGFATGVGYETLGDNDFFAHFGPSIYYRFDIPVSIRLSAGAFYLRTPDYNDLHEFLSLSGLWHVTEKKSLFRPYVLVGIDVMPSAFDTDLHVGLGNTFVLKDRVELFIESAYGNNFITSLQNNDPTRNFIRLSTGIVYKF